MTDNDFTLLKYENILISAIKNGYNFIMFNEIGRKLPSLNCILRHDIDTELLSCLPMLEIEKKCGVNATYFLMLRSTAYNLLCLEAREIVNAIIKDGHHIGIHFMNEFYAEKSPTEIVKNILKERDIFEQALGTNINSISFHQPTESILRANIHVPGLINTYNKNDMADFHYISDTNMIWKTEHPINIFDHRLHPKIQLLIHPIWWTENLCSTQEKWRNVFLRNNEATLEHWITRERSLENCKYKLEFDFIR